MQNCEITNFRKKDIFKLPYKGKTFVIIGLVFLFSL